MNTWYTLAVNEGRERHAELVIYDRIGEGFFTEGMTAKALLSDLSRLDVDTVDVRLNSPGGSVWDGLAIYNALRDHPAHVTTHIDGLAASIASVIALAGDQVNIAANGLVMIHDPRVYAEGTADDMRSAAAMLDRITDGLVDVYTRRGMDAETARAAMAAETWYDASEALGAGLVDSITGAQQVAASLTGHGFVHPPTLAAPDKEGKPVSTDTLTPVDTGAPDARYASVEALAAVERQLATVAHVGNGGPHPLAAYASFGDYALAVYRGETEPVNIVDQITSDNPGVMPPSWATDVHGIIAQTRPAVTATGGPQSAGDSGLDLAWPYFDGDLSTIVGEQVTQKTDVTSVKVSLKKGTATLKTYGGGSDVSYQLLMRSQPSYIDAMLRIYAAAYALATDNAYADALLAAATASAFDYDLAADATGRGFRSAMFAASMEVQAATGAPATVALVASDVFAKFGAWEYLPPAYGAAPNVGGQAQASTLAVDVSGLPIVHEKNLTAGSILVTNSLAASWVEDGPHNATAEVPLKLGRDYAIFGFGAPAVYNAAGVRKVTNLP